MLRALPLFLIVVVAALALPVATHASLEDTWPARPQVSPTPLSSLRATCVTPADISAELRLSATTVRAGERLPYTLVNTSAGCTVTAGGAYEFERRLTDGTWEAVQSKQMFAMFAVFVPAGRTYAKQALIPADFPPGSYRLLDRVSAASHYLHVAAQFAVTS
jgi:hypothetical protein